MKLLMFLVQKEHLSKEVPTLLIREEEALEASEDVEEVVVTGLKEKAVMMRKRMMMKARRSPREEVGADSGDIAQDM